MIQENLVRALVGIVVFVITMSALGFLFEDELTTATNWLVARIGFAGLCLILFVTDTLVTPFPPDILLVVIAKSDLAEHWHRYVVILGLISVCAGMLGWSIGRWLGHFRFARRIFGDFKKEHRDFIRRYGFWAVVVGSITPLPFSVTCWAAGVMGLRWSIVLAASMMFRIPRFVACYLLIASVGSLFGSSTDPCRG